MSSFGVAHVATEWNRRAYLTRDALDRQTNGTISNTRIRFLPMTESGPAVAQTSSVVKLDLLWMRSPTGWVPDS
jgi:hypothetical protein